MGFEDLSKQGHTQKISQEACKTKGVIAKSKIVPRGLNVPGPKCAFLARLGPGTFRPRDI